MSISSDGSEDVEELTRNPEPRRKKKKKRKAQPAVTVSVTEIGDDTATVISDDEDEHVDEDSVTSGGSSKRAGSVGVAAAPVRRHIIGLRLAF